MASDREVEVEYWTARFQQYDNQARSVLDRAIQLISVGLTILVTGAAGLVAYSRNELLLAIPVAVMLLWAVGARMLQEHHFLGAYRDHAEQTLARLIKVDPKSAFVLWHRFGGRNIALGFTNRVFFLVLVGVSAALLVGPFIVVGFAQRNLLLVCIVEAILVGIGVVLIAIGARENAREVGETYALLESEDPQQT